MFYPLLFLLFLIPNSYQCGVTTHNVISNTALGWLENAPYKKLIQSELPSFQAGSAFPDWGYACVAGNYATESELAHWLPFQKEMIAYMREGHTSPELISFLFGMVSHSVADVIWHDLVYIKPSKEGFITALQSIDGMALSGSLIDAGGEFVASYQMNLTFLLNNWNVPAKDIVQVYKRMGYAINESTIKVCTDELFLEIEAISKLPSEMLVAFFERRAPFLFENFQDWWMGGVEANALWTNYCWNSTIKWLETGNFSGKYCYPFTGPSIPYAKTFRFASKLLKELQPELPRPRDLTTFSRFGHSLVACDGKIAVGAPYNNLQRGSVYIYQGGEIWSRLDGEYSGDRFGYSLQCADLDLDGIEDLIIGAPNANNYPNMNYTGKVYVFQQQKRTVFIGKRNYNFGQIMDVTDIDGDSNVDLIIGAPFVGEVWYVHADQSVLKEKLLLRSPVKRGWFGWKTASFFYNNSLFWLVSTPNDQHLGKISCFDRSGNLQWEVYGNRARAKFGFAFVVQNKNLIVSAPSATDSLLTQGLIYNLSIPQLFRNVTFIVNHPAYKGDTFYSRLGWTIKNTGLGIVVSAPYSDGLGKVRILNGRTFVGTKNSEFGYSTLVNDDYLYIGAPRSETVYIKE